MNNELLTLFDIKDDIGTYYEINIRSRLSRKYCPN